MNKACILVFAKTPGLTPLKTRLAKTIGYIEAQNLYKYSVNCIEGMLQQIETKYNVSVYWALAEEGGDSDKFWVDRPFKKIWQGDGGLGERQNRLYKKFIEQYEHVFIIGTDTPHFCMDIFSRALEKLKDHTFIIGPSTDGGYYMFGGRQAIPEDVWLKTQYSQSNTRDQLLRHLKEEKIYELPCLTDLDDQDDIASLVAEMRTLTYLTSAQLKMFQVLSRFVCRDKV